MGIARDGGYVICENDLNDADFLLSFGLSSEWSFEKDFAMKNPNSPIHVYDYSVSLIFYVEMFVRECVKLLALRSNIGLVFSKFKVITNYIRFFSYQGLHF